jgi:hypothetical protein
MNNEKIIRYLARSIAPGIRRFILDPECCRVRLLGQDDELLGYISEEYFVDMVQFMEEVEEQEAEQLDSFKDV